MGPKRAILGPLGVVGVIRGHYVACPLSPHCCPIPAPGPSAVPAGGTAAFIADAHCSQEQYEEYYFSALGKSSKSNIESGLQHMPRRLL